MDRTEMYFMIDTSDRVHYSKTPLVDTILQLQWVPITAAMKLFLLAFLLVVVVCAEEYTSAQWEALKVISRSNRDFTNSLYQVLSRNPGNVIFSPASIQMILALTSLGARGSTAQQMIDGLHLPADQQTTKDGFRHLISSLHSNSGATLKIANKIYTDNRFPLKDEFSLTATNDFQSGGETVDFQHKPDEARRAVNSWVEEQTDHKITELLEEESVEDGTVMILANAVYFKGAWETTFDPKKTTQKPFHVSPNVTKEVPMMHIRVEEAFGYRFSEKLNADILQIPYVGDKVSLLIILPKERYGLADVESRISQLSFSNITSSFRLSWPEVKLALPKFKLDVGTDLKETLQQMGMTNMFSNVADFSGLTAEPTLISKVAHKAFIDVNEEGTTAAAATGVVGFSRSARVMPVVTFNADHPFIFFLLNTETSKDNAKEHTILFMGRYSDP